jgi:hypothetical protein
MNATNTANNQFRAIAITIIALLLMCSAFFIYNSVRLSNSLDRVRLEKETILSEKIHLNRSPEELKKEIGLVTEKNRELRQIPDTTLDRTQDKQKKFNIIN